MAGAVLAAWPWPVGALVLAALLLGAVSLALTAQQLRRTHAARRQAEGLLRLLIEGSVDQALLVLDPGGYIAQWNSGAERLYARAASDTLGRHYEELFTPEDRAARAPQNALETAARQGVHRGHGERLRPDGRRFRAQTHLTALRDAAGRLVGFGALERDITAQVAVQQTLSETRTALAQAQRMAALGRVSDGIAHDFTNVVHVIRTSAEVLQRRLDAESGVIELLQMILRNAERAARLSQHLLQLTRLAPAPTLTDVNEVVADVVDVLRQTLSEDIVLEFGPDEGLARTTIDRTGLEASLLNLAQDARDAMPDGGRLTLRTASAAGAGVLVSVTDTRSAAAPMAARDQPLYGLIEQLGARLSVETQPAQGTTVRLYLPCRTG